MAACGPRRPLTARYRTPCYLRAPAASIGLADPRLRGDERQALPQGVDERSATPYVLAHPRFHRDKPAGHFIARTADRRVRGLSPLGTSRPARPGAWRLLLQLTATLLQAIMPQPSLADWRRPKDKLRRHLHEPPRRRRKYQRMARLF